MIQAHIKNSRRAATFPAHILRNPWIQGVKWAESWFVSGFKPNLRA